MPWRVRTALDIGCLEATELPERNISGKNTLATSDDGAEYKSQNTRYIALPIDLHKHAGKLGKPHLHGR
jgi:hypothetical protein